MPPVCWRRRRVTGRFVDHNMSARIPLVFGDPGRNAGVRCCTSGPTRRRSPSRWLRSSTPRCGTVNPLDCLVLEQPHHGFGGCVVIGITHAANGGLQALQGQGIRVTDRGVLASRSAVVNQSCRCRAAGVLAPPQGHPQAVFDERGVLDGGGFPADDRPGVEVDGQGDVDESGVDRDVGEISAAKSWFGAGAVKSLFSRSPARRPSSLPGMLVRARRPRMKPFMHSSRMSWSPVSLEASGKPFRRSHCVIFRRP
jgi:hypothetical protein